MTELLILYNAAGSLLGHAAYAYHHLVSTPGKDCSACALTHGPKLTLSESPGWTELKARIERGELNGGEEMKVKQLHTDEIDSEVKDYLLEHNIPLPCVLKRKQGLETIMTRTELDGLKGDQMRFAEALQMKLEAKG